MYKKNIKSELLLCLITAILETVFLAKKSKGDFLKMVSINEGFKNRKNPIHYYLVFENICLNCGDSVVLN